MEGMLLMVLGAASLLALWELFRWTSYELSGPYTADSSLYWAVGRGIKNGLIPYRDLFESKPPGIFLLSAISLWLSGDFTIGYIVQALAILGIPILLGLAVMRLTHKRRERALWILLAVLFGTLLGLYSAWRSGHYQVESFGALFASLYIAVITERHTLKRKDMLIASLFMLLAIGFKEPFLLSMLAGALLLTPSLSSLWRTFCLPLLLAGGVGTLILAMLGYLDPYVTIYLDEMLGRNIHGIGRGSFPPLWQRGFAIENLFVDLNAYAPFLGSLMVILFLLHLSSPWQGEATLFDKIIHVFTGLLALYLTTLAVGIGGPWWNHHFVSALPFYVALFLSSTAWMLRNWHVPSTKAALLFTAMLTALITSFNLPEYDITADITATRETTETMKQIAVQVDHILENCGIDRYLFLGHNGLQLYGYTKHSPLGPLFFQNGYWLDEHRPYLRQGFLESVEQARFVVVSEPRYLGDLAPLIETLLAKDFTENPWPCAAPFHPPLQWYTFLYRREIAGDPTPVLFPAT